MTPASEPLCPADFGATIDPERKLVSVLFADVRASTKMIQGLDPEDAIDRLHPVLAVMRAAIHQYGGTVSSTQGDGVMALFGAPRAEADHATRACLSALEIHERVAQIGDPALQVRVGIHSGEVVLRFVRDDLSSIYDAAGPVVHLARRLEEAAPPGNTLISRDCFALTERRFEVAPTGKLEVRGFAQPIECYEIVRARQISRWQARASAGLSAFVGRTDELERLKSLVAPVAAGTSRVAVIEGEPGAGKSRLAHELLSHCRAAGWRVLETGGEATGQGVPWLAARRLLLAAVGAAETDPRAAAAARIRALLSPQTDHERFALDALLALPVDAPFWREAEASHRRRLVHDIFVRAIVAAAGGGPMAILVDDQHWLDVESQDAFRHLAGAVRDRPILMVVTRRPGEGTAWTRRAEDTCLPLGPLDSSSARSLFDHLAGRHAALGALRQRLVAHTGGVPLFLEEAIRRLADIGALKGEAGRYVPAGSIDEIGIPPNVQGVIAARIDRLPARARGVLQVASVIGDRISFDPLLAVSALSRGALHKALDELKRAALLSEVRPGPLARFGFAHDLVREVAYGGMVRARRRALHRRALAALTAHYGDQAANRAETLHRHAAAAEAWPEAARYARNAAARALELSAYRQAAHFYEHALAALRRCPDTRESRVMEIDIRLETRVAYGATAQLDKMLAHAVEAEEAARSIGDSSRAVIAATHKGLALNYLGPAPEALCAAEAAFAEAQRAGIPQAALVARFVAAQAHYAAGNFRMAADLLAPARGELAGPQRLARLGTTATTLALIEVGRAVAHASMGEFGEAEAAAESAGQIAGETGRPYDIATSGYARGVVALYRGLTASAIAVMEPTLQTMRDHEIRLLFPILAGQLGCAYGQTGRTAEAIELLREALSVAETLGHVAAHAAAGGFLGSILSNIGRPDDAIELLEESHATARQQGYRGVEANVGRMLAEARLRAGASSERVEQLLQESIDLATAIEAYPNAAHGRMALARLYLGTGRPGAARPLLRRAMDAYRIMAMPAAYERAQALLELAAHGRVA